MTSRSFPFVIFSGAYLILTLHESGPAFWGCTPSRTESAVVILPAPCESILSSTTKTTDLPLQQGLAQVGGHLLTVPANRWARPGSLQSGQGCLIFSFPEAGGIVCLLSSPWEELAMQRTRTKKSAFTVGGYQAMEFADCLGEQVTSSFSTDLARSLLCLLKRRESRLHFTVKLQAGLNFFSAGGTYGVHGLLRLRTVRSS